MQAGDDVTTPWVFRQLAWMAGAEEEGSSIRLNIPPTMIFNDEGHHSLLLTAQDGRLRVQGPSATPMNGNNPQEEDPDGRMRSTVEFMRRLNQSDLSSCVVWYADNEYEIMVARFVLKLMASTSWRQQLVALQGHVVPDRVEYGVYRASEDDLFGSSGNIREGAAKVGLNMLTTALAKVMCAHDVVNAGAKKDKSRVRLHFMRAVYVVDSKGTLWFSHVTDVHVRPFHDIHMLPFQKTIEDDGEIRVPPASRLRLSSERGEAYRSLYATTNRHPNTREPPKTEIARWLVASELKRVLGQAIDAGASIEELFLHFDQLNQGFVDSCALQKGLVKFGVGVSAELARELVQELGGTAHFTASDLASLIQHGVSDGQVRVHPSAMRTQLYQGEKTTAGEVGPSTGEPSVVATTNESVVHQINEAGDGLPTPYIATPQQRGPGQGVIFTAKMGTVGEETAPSEVLRVRSPSKDPSPKCRWDDLPCWARQSSRSAVQELMGHHERSLRKVRADTKRNPAVMRTQFEPRIKRHRVVDGDVSSTGHCEPTRPQSAQRPVTGAGAHAKIRNDKGKELAKGDLKLHVGGGNVMSYRWVARSVARPNHGGSTLEAIDALGSSQEAMGLPVAQHEPFILVAMPDLFMTLDSMERWLGGLLEHNCRGKLLLVGSLGLPGTQWADGEVLDAKIQAQGLSALLWELMERGELCLRPPVCVVLLGLGPGANAMLNFAGTFLVDEKFTPLRDSTRFVVVVNPFPAAPDTSPEIQQVKRQLQTLKRTLQRGAHHEQLQSLIMAMFSAEYVEKSGRARVLEDFWLTRQGLELPESARPKSAPTSCRVNVRSASTPGDGQAPDMKSTRGKVGVLQCIDGVLRGATLGALDNIVNAPVLLVTSTQDALDSSNTAEHCRASLDAEEVDSVFKLVSGNKHRRILVYPVHAGREILQEAPIRTLEIISGAIHAAQAQPIVPRSTKRCFEGRSSDDCVLDVITDCQAGDSASISPKKSCSVGKCVSTGQAKPSNDTTKEPDNVGKNRDTYSARPPERERDNALPKGRRAREFDARKERAAERKAKSERLKRQQELDRLKRAKRQEDEILEQHQECISMHQEDERSTSVDKHMRGLEVWALSVEEAKERALELTSTRDKRDQKLIEDQIARERADQHIQRNELFRQRKMDLLEQDGIDDCKLFDCDGTDEVDFSRESCRILLDQLSVLRRRILQTMQTELVRREQLETFRSQYHKLETDLREAERLQRTYARGGTAVGILGDVPVQGLKDIDASVARQHVLLGTYQSVLKERQEIWDITVNHIQKLKIAISTKESELRTTLQEVRHNIAARNEKAGEIRAKNESLATLRATVESKTMIMKKRVKLLIHEQSLLDSHNGLCFDSDIWQEGVTQRMSKAQFSQDLQVELTSLRHGIEQNAQQTKLINETLSRDTKEGQDIEMVAQKLGQIANASEERSDRMASKTVGQELRDILNAEQELNSAGSSVSVKLHHDSVAEIIRNKSSHHRGIEEKQWVALDILINKHLYKDLSVMEKEELQLNDEYKTELQAEDVARILALPHEIQLALPHMKSATEVDAHKLLTTYTLEHGDAEFAKADEQSQDHVFFASSGETNTSTGRRGVVPGEGLETETAPQLEEHLSHTPVKQPQGTIKTCNVTKASTTLSGSSRHERGPADLSGQSLSESPCALFTAADPLGLVKPTFDQVSSVSRDTIKPFIVVDAMSDVTTKNRRENDGELTIRAGEREVYRSPSSLLGSQESRVHSFTVVHLPPTYSVNLKVVLTFTGCMDLRGFNMGRLSAVLRRKPTSTGGVVASAGECIGYSPHSRQKLNTGDQFYQTPGTIFIQHCPKYAPLAYGAYEVEVTALGPTEYSMVVVAGQCELCASLVDKRLEEARNLKARLKDLECEQSDTWEAVRLRERQYHVCNTLIEEAGSECIRCQEVIDELCEYLRPRNVGVILGSLPESISSEDGSSSNPLSGRSGTRSSSSTSGSHTSTYLTRSTTATSSSTASSSELSETERSETWSEVAAIEAEHMHWGRLFTTRCQEKASVKKALDELMKRRRDGRAEKIRLEKQLQLMSTDIPVVVEVLEGPKAAADISRELSLNSGIGGGGRCSLSDEGVGQLTVPLETPARRTRQALKRGGWGALTLEEQQWITLDQAMCPDKYEWLLKQQEEEARHELARGKKIRKKPRKNPAIDQYRFHRDELVRITTESTDDLNRREMHVRKLLHKFHDDPQLVIPHGPSVDAEMHDVSLAERTRLKDNHHRTVAEKEWVSIDKILNPLIWKRAKGGVPGTRNDERPSEVDNRDILSDEQVWACPFIRDDLLRIWAQREEELATEDEKRAFKLLITYNGTCPGVSQSASRAWKGVQMGKGTKGPDKDIDQRIRCLQRELDRVAHNKNNTFTSSMLHAAPQRYATTTLRLHLEAEIDRLLREQVQQRERKNVYLIEDCSSSEEEEDVYRQGKRQENRKARRLRRRTDRGDINIFDARKRMLLESKKTPFERDNARRIANLGPGGCPACMSNPCKRTPVVNLEETKLRVERIADELHFARISTENVIESNLPMSVQRDGNTSFRRDSFIEELTVEQNHLRHMMKLHFIDEEFHEANRTSKQHVESVALHGYRTLLWVKDARVALEREHSRLVARVVAVEITHDILEWMLEGWHFGERPSRFSTLGYVPSMAKDLVKACVDTEGDEALAGDEIREQEEDRANMFTLPPGVHGSSWNNISERVVKEGGVHDQEIGFMERTMRFGLFCVAVMYFRARWLLHQQREHASELKLGWKIDTSVPVRAQRKRISQTTVFSTQAGYQRVKVRKEKEQAEVLADFAGFVAVEKREIDASQLLQRILRGHIGRKAANRWREKRAEFNATNSLMVSAAVSIQRLLRGSWGRRRAKTIRAGIARWLAHLVDDEAREFEAEILSTNKLEAMKRKVEELAAVDADSDN